MISKNFVYLHCVHNDTFRQPSRSSGITGIGGVIGGVSGLAAHLTKESGRQDEDIIMQVGEEGKRHA